MVTVAVGRRPIGGLVRRRVRLALVDRHSCQKAGTVLF
jgi:hypothetical protein